LLSEALALGLEVVEGDHGIEAECVHPGRQQVSGQRGVQLECGRVDRECCLLGVACRLGLLFLERERKRIDVSGEVWVFGVGLLELGSEEKVERAFGVECGVEVEDVAELFGGEEPASPVVEDVDPLHFGHEQGRPVRFWSSRWCVWLWGCEARRVV